MRASKVILDTNFLLIPGRFNIDIFAEIKRLMDDKYELCIMQGTLEELKKLAEGKSRDARAAKLGFVLAKQKGLKTMRGSKNHVDDDIVEVSDKDAFVATQDKFLKERVKEKSAKVITMRNKKHLIIE